MKNWFVYDPSNNNNNNNNNNLYLISRRTIFRAIAEFEKNKIKGDDLDILSTQCPSLYKLKIEENEIDSLEKFKCLTKLKIKKLNITGNPFVKSNEGYQNALFTMFGDTLESVDDKDKEGKEVESTVYGEEEDDGDEEFDEKEENEDDDDGEDDDGDEDDDDGEDDEGEEAENEEAEEEKEEKAKKGKPDNKKKEDNKKKAPANKKKKN